MSGFLICTGIFLLFLYFLGWCLPRLIAWLVQRKYNVTLRIGRIGIPYLKLCDIQISKSGYFIHIEEIGVKSSFLNSDLTKLITLVVKDVRINKDIGNYVYETRSDDEKATVFDFRNKQIPHFINTFAQFMAVHIYSISAMLLRSETPGCLTHATATELHLDGSVLKNAKSLLVTITLMEASAKVLRHAGKDTKETCLAEFSFGVSMETILVAQGPLSVEKLELKMLHTSAIINDGFYNLAQDASSGREKTSSVYLDDDIFEKIFPIVPKFCKLQIEDTSLKGVKENSQIEYISSLKSFNLNYHSIVPENTQSESMQVLFNFYMADLQLQNNKGKLVFLKLLKMDAKLFDFILRIYVQMNTLSLTYNHEVIHKWVYNNFLKNMTNKSMKLSSQRNNTCKELIAVPRNTLLGKILSNLRVHADFEFEKFCAVLKLNSQTSCFGFTHVRYVLDQDDSKRGDVYTSYFPKLLLKDRRWQMEVLVKSLWWSFKNWNPEANISPMLHVWNTPLYLGMCIMKFESNDICRIKVSLLLNVVQLEWSKILAEYILEAIRCVKQYKIPKEETKIASQNVALNLSPFSLSLLAHNCNCSFQSQDEEYFVCFLNTLTIDKDLKNTKLQFEEFRTFTLESNTNTTLLQPKDSTNYQLYVKMIDIEYEDASRKNLFLKFSDGLTVFWSTNVHLKCLLLTREITNFASSLMNEISTSNKSTQERMENDFIFYCYTEGVTNLHIKISEQHSAKVTIDELQISTQNGLSIENCASIISIDDADIFTINGFHWYEITEHSRIKSERLENENFRLAWNHTWGISLDLFKAVFPYHHNYAEAVHNEFVSVFKWLRIAHNLKKEPFTENSALPSDLLINIKEFVFEMSDDPFEVKLRDNFELLEDEYNESLKRQKVLKEKVAELCKTHLHLPAVKVDELYARLQKKNAEIYVQRSKQLAQTPQRTRLFAWTMSNIDLMVLADQSIHGAENVVRIMKEIDADSPWPEEGLEFSTLWCRVVSLNCKEWKFQLRDFPQPLLLIRECNLWGQLVGAEEVAPKRATRSVAVDLGAPFEPFDVERGMLPLKYYHDFNCEVGSYSYAFGPCWEPVMAQCNLSLEKIIPPSKDPSPPLPFWDKMRLILHGRLTMVVQQLTVLLHASLDPYNTTEEMELTWNQVVMDWTNAKFVYKGDLNIFVRTASKYDDCQILHLPNVKLVLSLKWNCLSNPNDHHSVIQCAPDKIPEYSINQVHDSFRAFRSQNVNLSIVLETRPQASQVPTSIDYPMLALFGSTLRWIENLKLILSGVTRPTRRGEIFRNVRPRKIQLSRHYGKVHLSIVLHKFQVCYWMSYAMQRGCELLAGRLSTSSEHVFSLVAVEDGLKHRPKAEWSIVYMNSGLKDSEIWLKSALHDETDSEKESMTTRQPVEKFYCLSVANVSYGRETVLQNNTRNKDTPIHRLVVYDLRGAWTKSNRNVAFALFDTFMKTKQMKKNLSTEALKGFRKDGNATPLKRRNADAPGTPPNAAIQSLQASAAVQDTPSPINKLQSGHAANMLQQLIAEAENKSVVFSDDLSSATRQQHLQGLQACQEDDVQHKNWQISLVNAQVLLKGCETKGYVILSAAKAEIIQRIHRPVWKDRTLVSKTTWTGLLECMQYYATVNAGDDSSNENIMWLSVENIQKKESTEISEPAEVPNLVGSGVSVGAVVSDTVGPSSSSQLQRIVSRCKCEFFYADYGDISVDPEAIGEVPTPPQEEVGLWDNRQTAVDAFTLMHHDLDVCTNSLQYVMLLDIVNNLLLHVEPRRKEALERLTRMRFQLQLHTVEDQRRPIQNQQTLVRTTVSKLRRLEKESYLISKALAENPDDVELLEEMNKFDKAVHECKNQLNAQSEELDMMLSCYKESQLLANSRLATTRSDKPLTIVRANEICFKHAQWRLTEADGQIGIADLMLSNFLYTKNSKSDDSVEHLLELGYLRMTNLLPNEIYAEVICPTETHFNMPVEHKRVLRIFCRERPPVGGISVKEHFEINLVPLTIGLTKKFYNTMMKFCFPERDAENIEYSDRNSEEGESEPRSKKSKGRKNRDSNFYVHIDDVEKMKERAEKNKLFVYIKIPEVPVKVSYKGSKEKNFEDLREYSLIIPTLEYHNMTWTWLDLFMAIRSDTKRVILSQAIKQKLQIKRNTGSSDENSAPHEEDKARILFGTRHAPENRSIRKGVFKFGK